MILFPERIKTKIVDCHKTIIQTMKLMDDGFTKALLVFDGEQFLGMITNGDLQRTIIAKKTFDTEIRTIVDNSKKKYAHISDDEEHIKTWMLDVRAEMMPVVDSEGKLVKVIFWDELFNDQQNDNRKKIDIPVVIMAGGKGTRLKPITNVIPKPLIPIFTGIFFSFFYFIY